MSKVLKKLKKARSLLKKSDQLTPEEKANIEQSIDLMKQAFDELQKDLIKLPREEAFRKLNAYLNVFETMKPEKEQKPNSEKDKSEPLSMGPQTPVRKFMTFPDIEIMLNQLSEAERDFANKLPCLKNPEAICNDCSIEKIRECIRTENPDIVDQDEARFRASRRLKEI